MDMPVFDKQAIPLEVELLKWYHTVVHHRMKRQGVAETKNAQAMLAALSEFHSGRFQSAWQSGLLFQLDFVSRYFALYPFLT